MAYIFIYLPLYLVGKFFVDSNTVTIFKKAVIKYYVRGFRT